MSEPNDVAGDRRPNPIDAHVGLRIRQLRKIREVSQEKLADGLRVTFQQVQKYERGSNRVSASKLYAIAGLLDVPVGYFFEGLSHHEDVIGDAGDRGQVLDRLGAAPGGLELAEIYVRLPSTCQGSLLNVAKTLGDLDRKVAA